MIPQTATPDDAPLILDLIRHLAVYENEPEAVNLTLAQLHEALFGPKPCAETMLAEPTPGPQGFAIWFETFNTWTGKPALYFEDVYVHPAARGGGIGQAMLAHLAKRAILRGHTRFQWSLLNCYKPVIHVYERSMSTSDSALKPAGPHIA